MQTSCFADGETKADLGTEPHVQYKVLFLTAHPRSSQTSQQQLGETLGRLGETVSIRRIETGGNNNWYRTEDCYFWDQTGVGGEEEYT